MNCKTQNTTLSCLWSVYPGQIDTIFENSLWFLCFILQNRNNKCLWYSFASVLWCCDFANLTDYVLQLQPTIILCIYQYLQFQHTEGYNQIYSWLIVLINGSDEIFPYQSLSSSIFYVCAAVPPPCAHMDWSSIVCSGFVILFSSWGSNMSFSLWAELKRFNLPI